jgi:hypothetical protein
MNTRLQEIDMLKDVTIPVPSNGRSVRIKHVENPPLMRWGVGKGHTSGGAR